MNVREDREDERRDRRDLDKRFARVDEEIKRVVTVFTAELSGIEGRLSESATWQATHETKDEERWKGNGEKWTDAGKRFDGMDVKLNAIIGTSVLTLLAMCGFFAANFVQRSDDRAERRVEAASVQPAPQQQVNNRRAQ